MLEDLKKWELESLTQRFLERLSHLKANHVTKDELGKKIAELAKTYEQKQRDVIAKLKTA